MLQALLKNPLRFLSGKVSQRNAKAFGVNRSNQGCYATNRCCKGYAGRLFGRSAFLSVVLLETALTSRRRLQQVRVAVAARLLGATAVSVRGARENQELRKFVMKEV